MNLQLSCYNCGSDYKNVIFKLYMLQFQGPAWSCHMSFLRLLWLSLWYWPLPHQTRSEYTCNTSHRFHMLQRRSYKFTPNDSDWYVLLKSIVYLEIEIKLCNSCVMTGDKCGQHTHTQVHTNVHWSDYRYTMFKC